MGVCDQLGIMRTFVVHAVIGLEDGGCDHSLVLSCSVSAVWPGLWWGWGDRRLGLSGTFLSSESLLVPLKDAQKGPYCIRPIFSVWLFCLVGAHRRPRARSQSICPLPRPLQGPGPASAPPRREGVNSCRYFIEPQNVIYNPCQEQLN